ncbi:MAG: family 16 glycosylhydrolase [Pseudomonadota bacterium]
MPNRPQSNGIDLRERVHIDALVLGVFVLQTAIALYALSPTPNSNHVSSDVADELILVDALPEMSPLDIVPETPPVVAPIVIPERGPRDLSESERIPSGSSFVTVFGNGPNDDAWHVATHSNKNHAFFANDWGRNSAEFSSDGVRLNVGRDGDRWVSGEVKTKTLYGYGRYEVVMKPAKASGLVSAFFTYTGPYFGDPHDEIDIEFVGNNTRSVEFNYFKNGRTENHHVLELPFDASEHFHIYAFEWYPDSIRWFIDGELVFETPEGDANIPRTPGSIYMNMWTGSLWGLKSWHGEPEFQVGTSSEYACVSFTEPGDNSRRCGDLFRPPIRAEGQYVGLVTDDPSAQIVNASAP